MAKTALVVDDSFSIRNMVSLALKEKSFEVVTAEDGVDALKVAKGRKLDVIVTDINMPNMDGFELIQKLRSSDEFRSIPILVLSTEGSEEKKEEGRRLGANGWMVKPFNPRILAATVSKICQ